MDAATAPVSGHARPLATRSWLSRLSTKLGSFGMTAALGLGAIGALAAQCDPPPPSPQQQVVDIANRHRADRGIAPLTVNSSLSTAAQNHSTDQARRDRMTHTGSDGSNAGTRISRTGYSWSTWAENVAAGQPDAKSVMSAWMGSSSHRANILNSNLTQVGIGLNYSSNGTPYWTMVLARPG